MTYLIPVLFAASGLLGVQCWNSTSWQTVCEGGTTVFSWPSVDLRPGERVARYNFSKRGQGTISTDNYTDPRFTYVPHELWSLKSAAFSDGGDYSIKLDIATAEGTVERSYIKNICLVVERIPVLNVDGKMHIWPGGKAKFRLRGEEELFLKLSCGSFEDRGDPPVVVEWKNPDGYFIPSYYKFFGNKTYDVWIAAPVMPGLYQCYIHPQSPVYGCLSLDSQSKLKDGAFFNLTEDIIHDIFREPPISRHRVRYSAEDAEAELVRLRARVQELEGQIQLEIAESNTYVEQLKNALKCACSGACVDTLCKTFMGRRDGQRYDGITRTKAETTINKLL